jgi:hypothetical protein
MLNNTVEDEEHTIPLLLSAVETSLSSSWSFKLLFLGAMGGFFL